MTYEIHNFIMYYRVKVFCHVAFARIQHWALLLGGILYIQVDTTTPHFFFFIGLSSEGKIVMCSNILKTRRACGAYFPKNVEFYDIWDRIKIISSISYDTIYQLKFCVGNSYYNSTWGNSLFPHLLSKSCTLFSLVYKMLTGWDRIR